MAKKLRIGLTGGGSGGHVYPLLAVASEINRIASENQIGVHMRYFGPLDEFSEVIQSKNIDIKKIPSAKLRRYISFQNILDVPKFFFSILCALWHLLWYMPDVVFSKGGTSAFPVVLAAWLYRIPVLIHESDSVPGLTNLLSAKFATRIACGFEGVCEKFRTDLAAYTGNPIRTNLLEGRINKIDAKKSLGLESEEPLVLILGGSQGSQAINEFTLTVLPQLLELSAIYHQTGRANFEEINRLGKDIALTISPEVIAKHPYRCEGFSDELNKYYSAADLVIARAGAGTIAEISAFAIPSILIPLPQESSSGHQRTNAYEYGKGGAAIIIEQDNLVPAIFIKQVKDALSPQINTQMSEAAKKWNKPDAAKIIALEAIRLAQS